MKDNFLGAMMGFEKELRALINHHSLEQYSDTPDYILATYLRDCLMSYCYAVEAREDWFGRKLMKDHVTVMEGDNDQS